MAIIEKTIHVNVPSQTIFEYLKDPVHLPTYWEHIIEVGEVEPHTLTAVKFHWVFKMLGVRFEGPAILTQERERLQLFLHFWGGIRGSLMWRLQASEETTMLETFVDYTPPIPMFKKHSLDEVLQYMENAVDEALVFLKAILESEHP